MLGTRVIFGKADEGIAQGWIFIYQLSHLNSQIKLLLGDFGGVEAEHIHAERFAMV